MDLTASPASGEAEALAGYIWQYDHVALMAYEALRDGALVEVVLIDPTAGRVDDCVLVLQSGLHAYQFKSPSDAKVTWSTLTSPRRTRSGNRRPGLLHDLVDGWRLMTARTTGMTHVDEDGVRVHLVMGDEPSTSGGLATGGSPQRMSLKRFMRDGLARIASGEVATGELAERWPDLFASLGRLGGLRPEEAHSFWRAVRFDLGVELPEEPGEYGRPGARTAFRDVKLLSSEMLRLVGEQRHRGESGPIRLTAEAIVALPGWESRLQRRYSDVFPVQVDRYEPLTPAVEALDSAVAQARGGYVALVGPPGSGKSTLLAQALSGVGERAVRYLAFVPNDPGSRFGRTTPSDFLHDVVLALHAAGLRTRVSLPEADEAELRNRFSEQLQAAHEDFVATGRRTLIVIDGLDHVRRENPTARTMLTELRDPDAVGEGVVFVIGAQSVQPLSARAREHLHEEEWRVIDLKDHRLSAAAIASICQRLRLNLTPRQVARAAELSDGHPLALDYILNDLTVGDLDASMVLARTPQYSGDISQQYAAYWEEVGEQHGMHALLGAVARIQPPIDMDWVGTFADGDAYRLLRARLRHLFRGARPTRWRFFHDSFRQYIVDRTSRNLDGDHDAEVDADHHRRLADLARASTDRSVRRRELFHAAQVRDWSRVLEVGSQHDFRQQFLSARAPTSLGRDITLFQRAAAERRDVAKLAAGIFAAAELDYRVRYLEETDVVDAMLDVDLVDEAADYLDPDSGATTRVPVWQALRAAARLTELGRSEGRQIFDAVDPPDLLEHRTDGSKPKVIEAWATAAPWFRSSVAIQRVIESLLSRSRAAAVDVADNDWRRRESVREPFLAALEVAAAAAVSLRRRGRDEEAVHFEQVLLAAADKPPNREPDSDDHDQLAFRAQALLGEVVACRIHDALDADDLDGARSAVVQMRNSLRGRRVTLDNALDLAESAIFVLAKLPTFEENVVSELLEIATRGAEVVGAPEPLSVSRFDSSSTAALHRAFRHRRLAAALAAHAHSGEAPSVTWAAALAACTPAPPPADRPAGGDISPDAAVQSDRAAIELADRIDAVVTHLATVNAIGGLGSRMPMDDLRSTFDRLFTCYPAARVSPTGSAWSVANSRRTVFSLAVLAAAAVGEEALSRLSVRFGRHVEAVPEAWGPRVVQEIGLAFHAEGVTPAWLHEAIDRADRDVRDSASVYDHLDALVTQAAAHASVGQLDAAQALVRRLLPESFGVNSRKDYQLPSLLQFLEQAAGVVDVVAEAAALAPYLASTIEWTEGSGQAACARLVEIVTRRDPSAGVRLLAWLYGTTAKADYDEMASSLFSGLAHRVSDLAELGDADPVMVECLADALGRMLAPFTYIPADALLAAVGRLRGTDMGDTLRKALLPVIDTRCLPTYREVWHAVFEPQQVPGVDPSDDDSDTSDFGDLVLDGERVSRSEAANHLRSVDDVLALRSREQPGSHFRWEPHVKRLAQGSDDARRLAAAMDSATDSAAVHLHLSEVAASTGDRILAIELAERSLRVARPDAWGPMWGSDRLRGYRQLIRTVDPPRRDDIARRLALDLVDHLAAHSWAATQLLDALPSLADLMEADHDRGALWAEVRTYFDGMTAGIASIPPPELDVALRASWWTGKPPRRGDATSDPSRQSPHDSAEALADLALMFLDHPHWALREGAMDALSRAIVRGSEPAVRRVRQLLTEASHDPVVVTGTPTADDGVVRAELVLDAAARAVVHSAHTGVATTVRAEVDELLRLLATSPSVIARHLGASRIVAPAPARADAASLPAIYQLELPPEEDRVEGLRVAGPLDGPPSDVLGPYADVLRSAADFARVDVDVVLHRAVSIAHAVAAGRADPQRFASTGPEDSYLPTAGAAIRSATLTVLDELDRGGRLPKDFAARIADPDLVDVRVATRPASYPSGETGALLEPLVPEQWVGRAQDRLAEIAATIDADDRFVLGALVEERPLERGEWVERYRCLSWTESRTPIVPEPFAPPPERRQSPLRHEDVHLRDAFRAVSPTEMWPGTALLVESRSFLFHSLSSDWVALRPDVGAACGWQGDVAQRTWVTADGSLAAEMTYWQDGHLYRSSRANGNTVARGVLVVATRAGLDDLLRHGGIDRLHSLDRKASAEGQNFEDGALAHLPTLR